MIELFAGRRVAKSVSALCLAAVAVCANISLAQDKIQISIAHLGPATSPAIAGTVVPLAEALRKTGKVDVTLYGAGSPYSNPTKYSELVENGVIDMAFGVQSIEKGLFPLNLLLTEPFIVKDIEDGTRAYMKVYERTPALQKEFGKNRVLQVAVVGPDQLHMRKEAATIDALKGMRVQVTAPSLIDILREVGASVAVLPRTAMYENLQKGVVDAGMGTWQSMDAFNLYEVTCCHLDWNAVVSPIYLAMNTEKYKSLPADIRAVVDQWSTMEAAVGFAHVWTVATANGKAKAKELRHKIATLSDAQVNTLRDRFMHLTEARIKDLEGKGLPARQVYQAILGAVKEAEAR